MVCQGRLVKTLAALVLSMLAGAALLASIEPGRSRAPASPGVLLHARGPASPQAPGPIGPWRQVLVLNAADAGRPAQAHVSVTGTGEVQVGPSWFQRRQLPGFDKQLVVRVQLPPGAERLSITQRQTLNMLLPRLCQELDLPVEGIQVASHHPAFQEFKSHLAALQRLGDALTLNR